MGYTKKKRGRKRKYSMKTAKKRKQQSKNFSCARRKLKSHIQSTVSNNINFDLNGQSTSTSLSFSFKSLNDIDCSTVQIFIAGKFDHSCAHCGALKWKSETNLSCCNNGKLKFLTNYILPKPLIKLKRIFCKDTQNENFFEKILG